MSLMTVLVLLLFLALAFWLIRPMFPPGMPQTIFGILCGLLGLLLLLNAFGAFGGVPVIRLR